MAGIPFYNSDETIMQTVMEILVDFAQTADLITLQNERDNEDAALETLLAHNVEAGSEYMDTQQPPQGQMAVRFAVTGTDVTSRGVNIGAGRQSLTLQVRVFLRTSTEIDVDQNPAKAGKGYINTTADTRIRRLRNLVGYAIARQITKWKIANPDGGDPICTGIYNIDAWRLGPIDQPLSGDPTILRAYMEAPVYIKFRSGVGSTSPI